MAAPSGDGRALDGRGVPGFSLESAGGAEGRLRVSLVDVFDHALYCIRARSEEASLAVEARSGSRRRSRSRSSSLPAFALPNRIVLNCFESEVHQFYLQCPTWLNGLTGGSSGTAAEHRSYHKHWKDP